MVLLRTGHRSDASGNFFAQATSLFRAPPSDGFEDEAGHRSHQRDFHGQDAAQKAAENFQRVFRDRQAPAEAPTHKLPRGPAKKLAALLTELQLAPSKSEADRLIKQKGVEIDGVLAKDPRQDIDLSQPREFLLRAGKKKFLRIVVE